MTTDIFDDFIQKANTLFRPALEKYGYLLEDVKVNIINGIRWSAHITYINTAADLKIILKQEPYYTDYGFSFFIFKPGMKQYNILYNVPHDKQDKENDFLTEVYEDLFTTPETGDLITGKTWRKLGSIPFLR
jgi:hypothetical protein